MDGGQPSSIQDELLSLTSWNTVFLGYAYPLHWSLKKAVAPTNSDNDIISNEDMNTNHR